MNKLQATILGAVIGGGIGWIIGSIVADELFPEFYDEDELAELKNQYAEYHIFGDFYDNEDNEEPPAEEAYDHPKRGELVDYTKYYVANPDYNKPSLDSLLRTKMTTEEDVEEYDFEDDEEYDEELPEEEIPYLDMDQLEEYHPSEYIDLRDTENGPYIITEDEFGDNEPDYRQTDLLYFSHDDVLTDAKNMPLQSISKTVGEHALLNFGVFASDDNVVYVQNDALRAQYRIRQLDNSYEHQVLGGKDKIAPKPPAPVEVHNVFDDYDDTPPEISTRRRRT